MTGAADDRSLASQARLLTADQVRAWDGGPVVLFVGVSTAGSVAHDSFPGWAAWLGRPWTLRGVDLPVGTRPEVYRRLVHDMLHNPHVAGAVVTSHQLRLFRAAADLLGRHDVFARLANQTSAVATGPSPAAATRDPVALAQVLPGLLGVQGAARGRHVLSLGAGGAAAALVLACLLDVEATEATGRPVPSASPPAHLVVADVREEAVIALERVAARCAVRPARVSYLHIADAGQTAALVAAQPPGTLVINATGLGKGKPGSPLPPGAAFPHGAVAWDLAYRGDPTFLQQARDAGAETHDGWEYFVACWAAALTAIAGGSPRPLQGFTRAAAPHRPLRPSREAGR